MIGTKLKELRTKKGVTISQLCDELQMNQNTYAKYERNERDVSTETLSKLADFYGVTTDYLLGREPAPNPFADLGLSAASEQEMLAQYMSFPEEVRAILMDAIVPRNPHGRDCEARRIRQAGRFPAGDHRGNDRRRRA